MKKLSVFLLVLTVLVTLSSCGAKDAATLYLEAMEKMSALEYVHSKMEMDYTIDISGVSMEMPMTMESRMHRDAENPVMDMTMTMSVMGMEVTTTAYYADNVGYTEAMGTKTKVTLEPDAFKEMFEDSSELSFTKDDFAEAEVTETDGKYSFSAVINGEKYSDQIMETVMSGLMDNLGLSDSDLAELDITIGDINLAVVINEDGYFEKYDMIFDMTLTTSGELASLLGEGTMAFHCDMKTEYLNIGEELTIEAPADLDSYVEAAA